MIEELPPDCLSAYRLDLHHLGLESDSEHEQSLAHLASCQTCRQRLAEVEAAQTAFATQVPSFATRPATLQEPEHPSRGTHDKARSSTWVLWSRPLMAMACLAVILWWGPSTWQQLTEPYRGTRGEQTPTLMVALRRDNVIRIVRSGESFRYLDRLRLAYRWPGDPPGYLYIVHRDQKGQLSPLYPATRQKPSFQAVRSFQKQTLAGSLEVDDRATGQEQIWACFSYQSLRFAEVVQSLPPTHTASRHGLLAPRGRCRFLWLFVLQRQQP